MAHDTRVTTSQIILYICTILPIHVISSLSKLIGGAGMSILYGWYGFDYYWILMGLDRYIC